MAQSAATDVMKGVCHPFGGDITDSQLFRRITTGIAPDGSSVIRDGTVVIPRGATAFNSDELLAASDLFLRDNYLDRAIALSKPGAQSVTIEGVETGHVVGRGYFRVSPDPAVAGPPLFVNNLSRVTATYRYDASTGVWKTVTIYPDR